MSDTELDVSSIESIIDETSAQEEDLLTGEEEEEEFTTGAEDEDDDDEVFLPSGSDRHSPGSRRVSIPR